MKLTIDGNLFRNRRKELKMTQVELASNLTSQTVVCSLEHGVIPKLEVLAEIMQRLSLSLEDVFPNSPFCLSKLDELKIKLDNENYRQVWSGLEKIKKTALVSSVEKQKFYYLSASSAFHDGRIEDADFACYELLGFYEKEKLWFFDALANTIKAQIWQLKEDYSKAENCFKRVIKILNDYPYEKETVPSMISYIRIYQALAEHFLLLENFKRAASYIDKALKILSEEKSTWHLGELLLLKSKIADESGLNEQKEKLILTAEQLYEFGKSPQLGRMLNKSKSN
ncbi:transcriptional regulator [Oenococcus oeni]|uniref:helix-turn-helix domain-containing protein n=1 Tax=Oenococcus oeni TaxID=1247 RepID=UPI0008F94A72|nr:helix-turn-helix transcriptional regulator [Oenococcus oeni]OIL23206.1 transcriptional regulator [Oenococcus oeni]OIL31995.1 transcriptional regulator [Oenococcus oeni]